MLASFDQFLFGSEKTCGKTKHESGFSQLYIRKDDSNEKYDTTTDAFIFIKHLGQFAVVVKVRICLSLK